MDENGSMHFRNWGFLEAPSVSSYLGLQLMSPASEKPLFGPTPPPATSNTITGPFHHHHPGGIPDPHAPIDYWINNDHPYYQSSYGISSGHSFQIPCHENAVSEAKETAAKKRNVNDKDKAQNPSQKEKKPRNRPPKKRAEIEINGSCMDISDIPTPVCSCTGSLQQCYRWGSGGWQSACCTMGMSVYPLPMSTKRRGARIAGRKMSIGAFKKVLEKLAKEGYDFSSPIDLKGHWAKHGTNKFVTIR